MPRQNLAKLDLKAAAQAADNDQEAPDMTFGDLCKAYMATVFDGADYKLRKWIEAFGTLSAWKIERAQLERCRDAMIEASYKPSTVNRDLSQIGTVYRWAKKKRLIPRGFQSPTRDIARFKEDMRIVHLSQVEQLKLLAGAVANADRRFQVYVRLLHETGARTSEILLRRWQDVDLDRGQILAEKTKTDRPRVPFFTRKTADLMRRIWPRRAPDDLLFEGRIRGCPITYKASWEKLVADIGRPDLTQHDMRHVVAQRLLKGRVTIAVASQVLGHSSTILQTRYGHLETAALQDAALSVLP
jgi:integrase